MLKLWRRPDAVKGTWRIRGTLGGRRYDESTGTDSRTHAEAIFAKRQKEILDAVTFGAERTTVFGEAVELYLQSGGEARFLEPLVRAFGPRRLADITQADVMRFVSERYPKTGSQGINRQVYTPLIAIYRISHRAGMGPMPAFIRPKIERKDAVRFATDDDLTRLIPACSARLVGAVVLMSLGGARASEACRVADPDVDWIRGEVTLRETKNGWIWSERMATAPMPKRWPKGKHFDCRGDGCSKCRVCRYLSFIEWTQTCGKPEGTSIERNTKIEAYLGWCSSVDDLHADLAGNLA